MRKHKLLLIFGANGAVIADPGLGENIIGWWGKKEFIYREWKDFECTLDLL